MTARGREMIFIHRSKNKQEVKLGVGVSVQHYNFLESMPFLVQLSSASLECQLRRLWDLLVDPCSRNLHDVQICK